VSGVTSIEASRSAGPRAVSAVAIVKQTMEWLNRHDLITAFVEKWPISKVLAVRMLMVSSSALKVALRIAAASLSRTQFSFVPFRTTC